MSFTITITQQDNELSATTANGFAKPSIEVYRQTVEELDLLALMNTINRKKRKPREKKVAK